MSENLKLSNTSVNTMVDAHSALLNGGFLRIYNGTQPATADTAITTQTLLAELDFANPAFGAAVAGIANANAIGNEPSAPASGTATWYRTVKSDGTTVVSDGSVGTTNSNLNLSSVSITLGQVVTVNGFVFTLPKG